MSIKGFHPLGKNLTIQNDELLHLNQEIEIIY